MVNKKAVNTVDATRKAKIIVFPFNFCLDTSIVALFNQLYKLFLNLLFIHPLRDLLVSEEDVVHTAVFAEVVHGLVLLLRWLDLSTVSLVVKTLFEICTTYQFM